MHVMKMTTDNPVKIGYTFLIQSNDSYELLSFPSENVQMFSDMSGTENVSLVGKGFILSHVQDSPFEDEAPGIPCYKLSYTKEKGSVEESESAFTFRGRLGNGNEDDPLKLCVDTTSDNPVGTEYILWFCYTNIKASYNSAIRICVYSKQSELATVSLDFGSEASQVHDAGADDLLSNINLKQAFCRLIDYPENRDYWQGREGDPGFLYKSIYHVHTKPGETHFGQLPMCNGTNSFVLSLLPANHDDYSNLVLLPNLKLIELFSGAFQQKTISFDSNSDIVSAAHPDLGSTELRQSVLRIILCNFLSVIMDHKRVTKGNLFLNFVLLVPNVYYQKKVSQLISGLYEDFYILRKNNPKRFDCYKGIEVKVVSESDASFFGMQQLLVNNVDSKYSLPDSENAHFLIIDAGKGTTDFSILKQTSNFSRYESVYRYGIPASGHVLTYAFYDALKGYFRSIGLEKTFELMMREAVQKDQAGLMNLVRYLERFKSQYESLSPIPENKKNMIKNAAQGCRTVADLCSFVSRRLLDESWQIPGAETCLSQKIDTMISLIKDSIIRYSLSHNINSYLRIVLTGRAFLLPMFREKVCELLINSKLVPNKDAVIFDAGSAKTICTGGALQVEKACVVNLNSGLIGSPSLSPRLGIAGESLFSRFKHFLIDKLNLGKSHKATIDFDFFYTGLTLENVDSAVFDVSGRRSNVGADVTSEDLTVYYTGEGFFFRHGNATNVIQEQNLHYKSVDDEYDDRIGNLVTESLFPFNIDSLGYEEQDNAYLETLRSAVNAEHQSLAVDIPTPSPIGGDTGIDTIDTRIDIDDVDA